MWLFERLDQQPWVGADKQTICWIWRPSTQYEMCLICPQVKWDQCEDFSRNIDFSPDLKIAVAFTAGQVFKSTRKNESSMQLYNCHAAQVQTGQSYGLLTFYPGVCCAKNVTWHSRYTALQMIRLQAQSLRASWPKLNTTRRKCVRHTISECFKTQTQLATFEQFKAWGWVGLMPPWASSELKPLVGPQAVKLCMLRHCMLSYFDIVRCSGWYTRFALFRNYSNLGHCWQHSHSFRPEVEWG